MIVNSGWQCDLAELFRHGEVLQARTAWDVDSWPDWAKFTEVLHGALSTARSLVDGGVRPLPPNAAESAEGAANIRPVYRIDREEGSQ